MSQQRLVIDRVGTGDHSSNQGRDLQPGVRALVRGHRQPVISQLLQPASRANLITGTNPAADTRFGSSKETDTAERLWEPCIFAGRIKDIVRVGGENASCAEVENALYELGGVELASVLPIDDATGGQIVVAAVKMVDASAFSESTIREQLRSLLAGYKIPKFIVSLDKMPMTESGKIQKQQLAEVVVPMIPAR